MAGRAHNGGVRLVGLAQAAAGVVLLAVAPGPTGLVSALTGAGVAAVGLLWLVRVLSRPVGAGAGTPVGRGLRLSAAAVGVVLVAVGVVALTWREASVRALAGVLSVGLVAHGVGLVTWGDRGRDAGDRLASVLLGAASATLGLVVLAWPRLSLHLVAALVGAWLVLVGLGTALTGATRAGPGARRRRLLPAVASVLVAALLLTGTIWLHRGSPRVVPDAFYTPPASVPDEPGRLIRARPLTTGVPDGLRGWLILYTTTDGAGTPAAASGTVLAPPRGTQGELPVVAVGHGTTGVVPRCAPSLSAAPFGDGAAAALEEVVRSGRVAVMTDYVGLGTAGPHAYLVGPDAAHAVLDSVRAAQELPDVAVGDQVVAWGHSQGGHAVLWTGVLAARYAPDLDLLGVAAFAPASDLHALADDLRTAAIGKLVAAYIAGSWDASFPELAVGSQLTPTYRRVVDRITDLCFSGRDVLSALATATQLSREVFVPGALDGPIGERLRENSPDAPIPIPVLLAQGSDDPLVLPAQQARYVAAQCAAGVVLTSHVYDGRDHVSLVAADSPLTADVVAWTQARFRGEPATASCAG